MPGSAHGATRLTLLFAALVLAVLGPWALAMSFTRGEEALSAVLAAATAIVAARAARSPRVPYAATFDRSRRNGVSR